MIETAEFENVTQIRMSREMGGVPVYWVSSYLVDGLLIDTGCSHTADELNIFLYGMDVTQIVNTHFHEDHVGGNRVIAATHHAPIYAHAESMPLIRERQPLCPYQELIWGYPVPSDTRQASDVIRTDHYTFDVVETPGHSVGHIALVERSRGWCFSGDLFTRVDLKVLRPEEDMSETIKSMERLISCDSARLVLFTSVGKIVETGREALTATIGYVHTLARRSKELSSQGYDIDGIVTEIFGGEHRFAELTNGQYTSANLVREVLKM